MDQALSAHEPRRMADRESAWLAVACGVGLALAIPYVLRSGSWLDEYWQLWISGAPTGALVERLINDTHPPWFNLLARAIIPMSGSDVVHARLVNLALATAGLAGGLYAMRGLTAALRWRIFLLLVASGGAIGFAGLGASFRVYPWLLVLAGLQSAILAAVVLECPTPRLLAGLVTAASVGVHYGHAVGAIAIAVVTIAVSWRRDRAVASAVAIGMIAAACVDAGFAIMQMPHWHAHANVAWADKGPAAALWAIAAVLADFGGFNLIAVLFLLLGALRGAARPVGWMLAPFVLACAGWLVLSPAMPMVPRYLASITAILAVAAAVGWQELRLSPLIGAALAMLIGFQPLVFALLRQPLPGWEAGARPAAAVLRACASSRLYAIPAGRFGGDPDGALSRFETPVMGLAYQKVGQKFGLHPQLVTAPTRLIPDQCPAIIWMEVAHGIEHSPLPIVLRRAQVEPPPGASARFIPTPNGALLLISSADRLQRRP